jgi:uncharacterized protein
VLVVDVNLLIYATNRDAADHRSARKWLEATLSGDEPVGLPWLVLLAFLRITTHPHIVGAPLSFAQAAGVVDDWLSQPVVRILPPSDRHWGILKALLEPFGTAGNLASDAHLAAIAIEHGATLCSADRDFGRFPNLKWRNPLERTP